MRPLTTVSLALLMLAAPASIASADDDDGYRRVSHGEHGYTISRQDAVSIARTHGMTRVKDIDRDDGKWELEGCTRDGREIEIDIHARTAAILEIDIDDDYDDC